jgi:HEAT repeat protein
MHRGRIAICLGLALSFGERARAADSPAVADDKKALEAARVGTDDTALLQFVRQRTLTEDNQKKIEDLIRLLDDDAFAKRQQASRALVAVGPVALPLLRQAATSPDAEVKRRAKECVRLIEAGSSNTLMAAAARLIAVRKPPGAAEVLLAYLPFADDELVVEEIRAALAGVTMRDGKPEEVVVKALQVKVAAKRAAAAEALCRAGALQKQEAGPSLLNYLDDKAPRMSLMAGVPEQVRRLLKDADLTVRLRVALALADLKESEALPVLIALLGDLPPETAWQAEDILRAVAGDKAPDTALGDDDASRRKCRDSWASWWKAHGANVDLGKINLRNRTLGYTLLVMQVDKDKGRGRIREVRKDGKTRWEIGELGYPLDACVVPGNRVLIADSTSVSERNFKGDVIWEKAIASARCVQRLANGNTFIVAGDELIEVDRAGQEVTKFTTPDKGHVLAAKKLQNGQIGCLSNNEYLLLDAKGKQLKAWPVGNVATVGGLDVLPTGGIVIAQVFANKVVEHDSHGKVVWEAQFTAPTSVVRLLNGHTLVAAWNTGQVAELNSKGKIVWEYKTNAEYSRARRR